MHSSKALHRTPEARRASNRPMADSLLSSLLSLEFARFRVRRRAPTLLAPLRAPSRSGPGVVRTALIALLLAAPPGASALFAPLCGPFPSLQAAPDAAADDNEPCRSARIDSPGAVRECWKRAFAERDRRLNTLYQKLRKNLPRPRSEDLLQNSREWVRLKTFACATAASAGREPLAGLAILDGRTPAPDNALWFECQYRVSGERLSYIQSAFQTEHLEGFADSGVYSDGLGGRMLLVRLRPDRLAFSVQVVRGPTAHIGRVDGAVDLNGNRGVFRADYELGGEKRSCRLIFELREAKRVVHVSEQNSCEYFRGARAFFDGDYRRIE